jgi:hypothetical protein
MAEDTDCENDPCPIDCELSEWTDDAAGCTVSCGGGTLKQTRSVTVAGNAQGDACPASREQTITCNTDACPVDCELEDWKDDGGCSVSCGGGKQIKRKAVQTMMANGGIACPASEEDERYKEEDCNPDACPVDCVLSGWSAWSTCSATCGDGLRNQSRTVETEPANGGVECEETFKEESCKLVECPIDCEVADWAEWTPCSVECGEAGWRERHRSISTNPEHAGEACPELYENVTECPGLVGCPVNCELGEWIPSDCSTTCGEGVYSETREITVEPKNNGNPCQPTERTDLPCEDLPLCPVDCQVSDESAEGTCSKQCGGGTQIWTRSILVQAVGGGAACPTAEERFEEKPCNTQPCPGYFVGETGAKSVSMNNDMSSTQITLNVHYEGQPVFITGPIPARGEAAKAVGGRVVIMSVQKDLVKVEKPADEVKPEKEEACKCTGGPSAAVPMGDNNVQYPISYGDFCSEWSPRDPAAAAAADGNQAELTYLGDGWAYNSVSKMRVYVYNDVDPTKQTIGEPVVLPDGVSIPDFPGEEGTKFPADGSTWCYVSSDCSVATSDGWGTWSECGDAKAWDDKTLPPMYPQATVCPIANYRGSPPGLTQLTLKYDATAKDSCVGKADHNECHEQSGFGGKIVGYVSTLKMNDTMTMIQSAYNPEAKDTCVFHEGAMETFCKATVGEYGSITDLGYAFTVELPGTLPLKAYWDIKGDSCATADDESCGNAVIEGTLGYIFDPVAVDAWGECGAQAREDKKYVVTLVTEMDGAPDASSPKTEKVPWIAMKQGVFTTTDGKMIQAGVTRIPADEDFHSVKFFSDFPSTPAVFVSNLDPVDFVRVKGETGSEFTASAYAGFADIETHGECAWNGEGPVQQDHGNAACQTHLGEGDCHAATAPYWVNEPYTEHWEEFCWWDVFKKGWPHKCGHSAQRDNWVEKTKHNVCVYNENVIGKCRGVTPLDWGSCKNFVTSETECKAHPECVWETVAAEHTAPLVEVHWMAVEKTDAGVLGAYPFIAGDTTVGEETEVTFDAGFTQVPLVYGSASGDFKADVRTTVKDVSNFSMILQGAEADEKVSYFVYNGQSSVGTAFKAQGTVISYAYETAKFGECEDDGSGISGTRSRTIDCKRSDGESVQDFYCAGTRPTETEACTLERFFVMSGRSGECLGPTGGSTASFKKQLSARVEKCDGDKNKFKITSGQHGGFKLVNAATGLCYCEKSKSADKMEFHEDCDTEKCELKKIDEQPDGTFILTPVSRGENGCLKRPSDSRKIKVGSSCGGDGSRFTFVKEGTLEISEYHSDPEANGFNTTGKMKNKGTDKTGTMITDGEQLSGDFATSPAGMKGVSWHSPFNLDVHLVPVGAVQAITVGFNFKKKWDVRRPNKVSVQCSSDEGATFGNAATIEGEDTKPETTLYNDVNGGRKTLTFMVADICGADTNSFRVTVKPKGEDQAQAMLDEIQAFAPFTLSTA